MTAADELARDEAAVTLARDYLALLRDVAATAGAVAEWADDKRAGGASDKWLLMHVIAANRLIARAARGEAVAL